MSDVKRKKPSKGKAARTKGHSFERLVAILLREIDPDARRNVEETQKAGHDIKTNLRFGIQCKCLSQWRLHPDQIMAQAEKPCTKDQIPLGVVKIDRKKPVAIMYLDDFVKWVKEAASSSDYLWRDKTTQE